MKQKLTNILIWFFIFGTGVISTLPLWIHIGYILVVS